MTFACSVKHEKKINEIHADFSNLLYLFCLTKITIFVVFKAFRKAVCFDPESDFQNNMNIVKRRWPRIHSIIQSLDD